MPLKSGKSKGAFVSNIKTEIAAGKPPADVVPKFINSVVERVVQKRHVNGAVDARIIDRASKSPQTMPNRHNGSTYARNWRDA